MLPPDATAIAASQHSQDRDQATAEGLDVGKADDESKAFGKLGTYISKSNHKKRGPPGYSDCRQENVADSASRFLAQPGTDNETQRRVPKAPLAAARRSFMKSYENPDAGHRTTSFGGHPRPTEIPRTTDIGPLACHSGRKAAVPHEQRSSTEAGPTIIVTAPTSMPGDASTNDSPPPRESDDDDDDSDIPNDIALLRRIKSDIGSPHMSATFSPFKGGV